MVENLSRNFISSLPIILNSAGFPRNRAKIPFAFHSGEPHLTITNNTIPIGKSSGRVKSLSIIPMGSTGGKGRKKRGGHSQAAT